MSQDGSEFGKYATQYDPIKIGSIDGTDTEPHDRAIWRALYSEYIPNKQVKGDPQHTIFIGRLNPRTTQETIHSEFSKFGKILHCRLVKDIVTRKSKQYAFVEYESRSSVDKALREMHAEYIDGTEIIVEREAERRLAGWKPRRLGGGFGGRKESGQLRFGCRVKPFREPIIVTQKQDNDIPLKSTEKLNDIEVPKATTEVSIGTGTPFVSTKEPLAHNTTLDPLIECTWKPSEKTEAETQYYENDQATTPFIKKSIVINKPLYKTTPEIQNSVNESLPHQFDIEASGLTEGVTAEVKNYQFALVKLKLSQDFTFGCVLTAISEYWTLTAASCIESIEEVDAVDSFVIMDSYVETYGKTHTLSDILIHPEYQGVNKKYDVATLKSEDSLINKDQKLLQLPTMLDALLLTIGEQLNLISYGHNRLEAYEVSVHMLSGAQCASTWAPRHLVDKGVEKAGDCGALPLCLAALAAREEGRRGCPQLRCAGAPLIRDGVLIGVSGGDCGEPCTPFSGPNVALTVDWLRSVVAGDE